MEIQNAPGAYNKDVSLAERVMPLLGKIDPLWRRVLSAAVIATGILAAAGMTTPVKA